MEEKAVKAQVMHSFKESKAPPKWTKPAAIWVIVLFLGIGTGFLFTKVHGSGKSLVGGSGASSSSVEVGKTYGSNDTKTFKDSAEGTLQSGGINGEGQYHLVRPGGDSQNVYLTSSIVDLSQFIGHKVTVWGETQAAQHAGWLMDVGKVQVEQ